MLFADAFQKVHIAFVVIRSLLYVLPNETHIYPYDSYADKIICSCLGGVFLALRQILQAIALWKIALEKAMCCPPLED